jgi:NAD(P)-dependent dehydrogenase (short-subunit alcohol dehydrogenase family)
MKWIKKIVKEIFKKFRKIDILINNAGIWTDENLEEKNPELRKIALETNVLGHINFTYEILPYIRKEVGDTFLMLFLPMECPISLRVLIPFGKLMAPVNGRWPDLLRLYEMS